MTLDPIRGVAAHRHRLGRYEVLAQVASGAMGVVYLGRLQGVGGFERLFAIKVLHDHLAKKAQVVNMLLNEARLAAQIQHPNVVSTVDAEVSSSGEYYVVMEYVDGFTLCELLDHPRLDALRRVRLGLRALLDATAGLDAAHRLTRASDGSPLAIVHRDVSPSNILISLQGAGMIADFGIARAAACGSESLPGVIKGTPCYMAPEQVSGAEPLDARSDVFSLGAVLWEVLTGEQLFYSPAGVGGVFSLVLTGEIPAPSSRNSRVPPALDAVCLKALARDREARYQSAHELAEDLERVAREHDLVASNHEAAEALAQLFAEQIERRRALLPAPSASEPLALPESRSAAPTEANAPAAFDAELARLPLRRPLWPLGAAAVAAALAGLGLALLGNAEAPAPRLQIEPTTTQTAGPRFTNPQFDLELVAGATSEEAAEGPAPRRAARAAAEPRTSRARHAANPLPAAGELARSNAAVEGDGPVLERNPYLLQH